MKKEYIKSDDGFTIIESLVSLLIIGLVVSLCIIFLNILFSNPGLFLKSEALNAASREIERCIEYRYTNDTTYTTSNNLVINRNIKVENNIIYADINVLHREKSKNILTLHVAYKKEN